MIWIALLVLTEIIVLFLPVTFYDKYAWTILIVTIFPHLWFADRIKTKVIKTTKTTGLTLVVFGFMLANMFLYIHRKDKIFKNNETATVEASVAKVYRQGGGRTGKRYYIEYYYQFDRKGHGTNKRYSGVSEVKYNVYNKYNEGDSIKVEYIIDRPEVSRALESKRDND